MKKFFNQLFDQFTITCLITNAFNLFFCLLAIMLGEESWLSLRKSVHGMTGGTILFIMFGLPLVWAFVMVWLKWATDKLNSKV
jgi:hypothetical protein